MKCPKCGISSNWNSFTEGCPICGKEEKAHGKA